MSEKAKHTKRRPLTAGEPVSASQKQRTNLTLNDKLMVLGFIADNPKLSQTAVALHFQKKGFKTISQLSVSRIINGKKELREAAKESGNLGFKRPRVVEFPEIEEALAIWTLQAQTKGIRITDDVLHKEARRFAELQGIAQKDFLSLSNGWVDSFKQRHGLKQFRFHGEAGSVDETAVHTEQVRLRKITDQYALPNIMKQVLTIACPPIVASPRMGQVLRAEHDIKDPA